MLSKQKVLEHTPTVAVSFLIGAALPALISLNIFARTEDNQKIRTEMAEYKAYVAENYVKNDSVEKSLDKINTQIIYLTKLVTEMRLKMHNVK